MFLLTRYNVKNNIRAQGGNKDNCIYLGHWRSEMYRYTAGDKSGSFYVRPIGRKTNATWVMRVADLVLGWGERARQRRHLAELDDRLLRDIGVSRVEVEAEVSLPFWRPQV
jgi:uncharacterized protein YjiS (DUF1127 family)